MEKPHRKQGKEIHNANTLRYASRSGGHKKEKQHKISRPNICPIIARGWCEGVILKIRDAVVVVGCSHDVMVAVVGAWSHRKRARHERGTAPSKSMIEKKKNTDRTLQEKRP